jgi:hypothetical protein
MNNFALKIKNETLAQQKRARMLLPKSRDTDPPHLKKQCEVPQGVRIVSMKNIS